MRTVLHMVTKDNSYGYLDCTLTHNLPLVDDVFVVDDVSTDDTVEILRGHNVKYIVRPDFIPSLEQDEVVLRFFSWIAMFNALELEEDDWIISVDPDDLLIGDLTSAVTTLYNGGFVGAELALTYLWKKNQKRIDGLWDRLCAVRMAVARGGGQEFDENQRLPAAAYGPECYQGPLSLRLVNLGFLSELDKAKSYDKMLAIAGKTNAHIASVLKSAEFSPVEDIPKIWEGMQ